MARTFSKTPSTTPGKNLRRSTGFVSGLKADLQSAYQLNVEANGLDAAIAELQKYAAFGERDAVRTKHGMQLTMSVIKTEITSKTVPVRTGRLKKSIFSKVRAANDGNVTGRVGSDLSYPTPFVLEGGRKAHESVAYHSNRQEDKFQKRPGGRWYRKVLGYGKVGAIVPRRWMWHGYSRNTEEIAEIWKTVLKQITEDLAAKIGKKG